MTDFGLDLAVIGNGRTAALVEPSSRLVWWCFPRFDGDPVFCRLLAGEEEKGFCDVVLDGMVATSSDYVRNTALVSTVLPIAMMPRCGSRISPRASANSTACSARLSWCGSSSPLPGSRALSSASGRRAATECRFRQSRRQQSHHIPRR
jgi:hypothetical protein